MKRIPYKIATRKGFSGYTMDQWKLFIIVYAIPLMWDLLNENNQKILTNFVRACFLLVSHVIDNNLLNEAYTHLLSIAQLVKENYGSEFITLNIHFSLHLAKYCWDYGLTYSFWCYSFERMNGILDKLISIFFFFTMKILLNWLYH